MAIENIGTGQGAIIWEKARIKAGKLDYELHVALLMKRAKLSKPDAIVAAYLDGPLALDALMNPAPKPDTK